MTDNVNHPSHYNQGSIETIDFIEAVLVKYPARIRYHLGNVIKYVSRAPYKNGKEDLEKARWYLNRALKDITVPVSPIKPFFTTIDTESYVTGVANSYQEKGLYLYADSILYTLLNETGYVEEVLRDCLHDLDSMIKKY